MTPRKQETMHSTAQPVRMYKVIAISFLVLTLGVFGSMVFLSAKRATITIETKAEPVLVSGVFTVGPGTGPDHITGMVTTTVVSYEQTVVPTGTKSSPAVATGQAVLHNNTDQDQTLIINTRLLSTEGVLFRMKKSTMIPAHGTARVDIYADVPGATGNVSSTRFSIPGLPLAKQSVIFADSDSPTTGGVVSVGAVQKTDIDAAVEAVRTALIDHGKNVIMSGGAARQGVFALQQESIASDVSVGAEVSQFVVRGTATVVGALYDAGALEAAATSLLTKRQVAGADILTPSHDAPTATVDATSVTADTVKITLFHSGIATLNPESKALTKSVFFGKTSDEVRRYVLSLDRVKNVSVTFSPSWVTTVPSVDDHVKVIVKQVQ